MAQEEYRHALLPEKDYIPGARFERTPISDGGHGAQLAGQDAGIPGAIRVMNEGAKSRALDLRLSGGALDFNGTFTLNELSATVPKSIARWVDAQILRHNYFAKYGR
jgi:hypothetical protein